MTYEIGKVYQTHLKISYTCVGCGLDGAYLFQTKGCSVIFRDYEFSQPLVEYKEPKSGFFYINVYDNGTTIYSYNSRQEANLKSDSNRRIACVRVPWVEGQFDD